MRWGTWGVLALVVVMLSFPTAAAQDGADLVLEGTEGPDCLVDGLMCFLVAEGSPDEVFVAGQEVTVGLVATGQAPHNVHVTTPDQADENRIDTEASAAFANSETIDSGENTTFTFTVPVDAEELYLWCDVGEHEAGGMWLIAEVQDPPAPDGNATGEDGTTEETPEEEPSSGTGEDGDGSDGTDEENGTPLPAWAALAGLLVAGLATRTSRR